VYVCLCKAITDRTVASSIDRGAATLREVAGACGAGTICGGCRPAIAALLERFGQNSASGPADVRTGGLAERGL
jgi:bacterioferritin-associated ferredoxin